MPKQTRAPLKGRREDGNIMVELALALPLLLLIIAGALDLGLLFWEKHVLTNASREGARAAAKAIDNGTNVVAEKTRSQVRQVVQNYLDRFHVKDLSGERLVLNDSNFNYTWAGSGYGTLVTVTLNQIPYKMMLLPNFRTFFGYTRQAGDEAFYLRAQTIMAAEWVTAPSP